MRVAALVTGAAAVAALVVVVYFGRSPSPTGIAEGPLPVPPSPAFTVSAPRPLVEARPSARWAEVLRPVVVRSGPSLGAAIEARLAARTPEGTQNLVLVRGRAADRDGKLWIMVDGPGLPGEGHGWVPRGALGPYHAVHTRLVVDLASTTATLVRHGRVLARFAVGIGKPSAPTPRGEFYVRNRLTRYPDEFYGPLAFGTSVRSPSLTDWPDGGFVGIHGTNRPDLLPGRVSHGCIRLRNRDILLLGRLMPVGTPITIR